MTAQANNLKFQNAYEKVRLIKKANEQMLMSRPNVVGVGIGMQLDDIVLVVLVSQKPDTINKDWIPTEIDGIQIDVRVIGEISAQ